jgi:hypothetical protein
MLLHIVIMLNFPLLFVACGGEKKNEKGWGHPNTPAGGFAPCTPKKPPVER